MNSKVGPCPSQKMNGCTDAHHEYTGKNNAKLILHWLMEMQTTKLFTSHVTVEFAAGQCEWVGRAQGRDGGVEWGWGGCLVGWGVGVGVGVGARWAG
jgi:hypothetical protein